MDPAIAALPDVPPDAVRTLYTEFQDAERDRASSNDIAQLLDDWFRENGYPSVLYR
ncbi:hypothetical protein [Micromonospora aurantiaca (nom. illeg.)]|uniref:hypothetical protein n=1 Tax=Micromonospora aurantiaca (nom. illeg.) TaxID=47850 RepID=UPI0033E802DA